MKSIAPAVFLAVVLRSLSWAASIQELVFQLRDKDPHVRKEAAVAIARTGQQDFSAIGALDSVLRNTTETPLVRGTEAGHDAAPGGSYGEYRHASKCKLRCRPGRSTAAGALISCRGERSSTAGGKRAE